MGDGEDYNKQNNFQNFIEQQKKIIDSIQKEDDNPACTHDKKLAVLNVNELFKFLEEHFSEFHEFSNLNTVVSFLHRCLVHWSENGDFLENDIGIFLFNFLDHHLDDEGDLAIVVQIIHQILYSLKSFEDNKEIKMSKKSHPLKLQLDNRWLAASLDQLRESSFPEFSNKIMDLEEGKNKLNLKLEQMQENMQCLSQKNNELENVVKDALKENKKMQITLDNRQKAYDKQSQELEAERSKAFDLEKQVEALKKEKYCLQTLNGSIQLRADDLERVIDTLTKETEQYVEKLKAFENTKATLYELQAKLKTHERENASLAKEVTKLKKNLEEKTVLLDKQCTVVKNQTKKLTLLTNNLKEAEKPQVHIHKLEIQNPKVVVSDLCNKSTELRKYVVNLKTQISYLKRKNTSMTSCAEDLAILRREQSKLTDDFRKLFATNDRLKIEYINMKEQYKMILAENGKMKLQHNALTSELDNRNNRMKMLEAQYAKMSMYKRYA